MLALGDFDGIAENGLVVSVSDRIGDTGSVGAPVVGSRKDNDEEEEVETALLEQDLVVDTVGAIK